MRSLSVYLNDARVGQLTKSKDGKLSYNYDAAWLARPGARPISLSLPLARKVYTGDLVYNFFDNLLPDHPGIRRMIQAKYQIKTSHPFDMLAVIGQDCVGAIALSENELPTDFKSIKTRPVEEKEIAAKLRDFAAHPLGMDDADMDFRISLAGVQEKTAYLYYQNKWHVPLGPTPTSHIFKLPIGRIENAQIDLSDSPENEWLMARLAKAFGFEVANCEICLFEEIKVLVVERFDRRWAQDKSWLIRLPQEDMCQAHGVSPNLKYQADGGPGIKSIMDFLLNSEDANHARETFFKAQVFFWLLCAIDGHAKNYSVFIMPDGRFKLTPFYDMLSAYPLFAEKQLHPQKAKLAMALRGSGGNIYEWNMMQRRHILSTGKYVGYASKICEDILDEIYALVEPAIQKVQNELTPSIPSRIYEPIFEGLTNQAKLLQG